MAVLNNNSIIGSSGQGSSSYQVSRSLRFNSADSAYLNRTPASAGNRKTWTWAGWVKRSALSTNQRFFGMFQGGVAQEYFRFESNDTLKIAVIAESKGFTTTQVFRDASAWYHIVVALDTPQATDSNRLKLYVNGTQVTTFSSTTYPVQDSTGEINNTYPHFVSNGGGSEYFNGYLADVHFIDGQALTPSSFAETDATTGQWIPKLYSGSYGTNGFKLNFSDNSAATAAALGKDTANSNNWTPNNFSVTAGAGNDSLVDTPTSYGTDTGAGGEVRGNYATLNPLDSKGTISLTNGNLDVSATGWATTLSTIKFPSGKWYLEFIFGGGSYGQIGVSQGPATKISLTGEDSFNWAYNITAGVKVHNGSGTSWGSAGSANDVFMIALDTSIGSGSNKIWWGKNGTWFNSGAPASGSNAAYTNLLDDLFFAVSTNGTPYYCNFGQRAFSYQAPSGYKCLVDANLTAPVIAKPNTVMDVVTYTGNGSSSRAITGLNFSPDFVWTKSRNQAYSHYLFDAVRGANKALFSDTTDSEQTYTSYLLSFDSAGFTVGNGSQINANGDTYVGWAWDAGTSTVTNTQGSITSSVRANASAGFSIVTYTSSSSVSTVGHGLGVAPYLIITKNRSVSNAWWTYHNAIGNTKAIRLDATDAQTTMSSTWNNTSPTSTVFTVGGEWGNGNNIVAYCFAPVAGYSSFGSYTGNGSTNGPFVYTGFRPRWVMIKGYDASNDNWKIYDTSRSSYNVMGDFLAPNNSNAEVTNNTNSMDMLSNGFKMRSPGDTDSNFSGYRYIYAAFAEFPFQYARAR